MCFLGGTVRGVYIGNPRISRPVSFVIQISAVCVSRDAFSNSDYFSKQNYPVGISTEKIVTIFVM